jgi:hypothetical protein
MSKLRTSSHQVSDFEREGKLINPFREGGEFTLADKFTVLREEVRRTRTYLEGLVSAKRMLPENFASKLGALEALLEDLQQQQTNLYPAELNGTEAVIIYLENEAKRREFLKWAADMGFPARPA